MADGSPCLVEQIFFLPGMRGLAGRRGHRQRTLCGGGHPPLAHHLRPCGLAAATMLAAILREEHQDPPAAAASEPEPEPEPEPASEQASDAAAAPHPPPALAAPEEIVQKCVRDGVLATALHLYTSASCADAPPEARAVFRSGESLFTSKSWAAAAELVQEAMDLGYPDETRCHNLLGVCYYWLGRDEDATTHLLQAQSFEARQYAAAERHPLVDDKMEMAARVRSIVISWFEKHSTDGRMSREQCAAFVRSCRHDQCQEDDERIVQLFASHDSNADGYLSLKDFLSIYREKARDPKGMQVVWQNLNAQGFGPDLRPKLKPQHEPQLLLHIIGRTAQERAAALHCTACNKTVTISGSMADKSDQVSPHPLLKVCVCGGCFDRYMLSIVEPSSAVSKVTSCLYPDLLGGTEGKFATDADGRELRCRWCGEQRAPEARVQCDTCCKCICEDCVVRNFGPDELARVREDKAREEGGWKCYCCDNLSLAEHQSWLMRLISCAASEKEEKRKRQNRRKRLRQKEKKRTDLPDPAEADDRDSASNVSKRTGLVSELPGSDWAVLGPWRVDDWAAKVSKQTESLCSETYEVGERKWRVVLSGPSRNETGYVGLFLGCPESPEPLGCQNRARFILSIINQSTDVNAENYDSQE